MNKLFELFGQRTDEKADWKSIIEAQLCPYSNNKCFKTRKSDSDISIGTCTGRFGSSGRPLIICPHRFLAQRQIFSDCLPLLRHVSGNELHIVREIQIPGGNVDYFLVTARNGTPTDFVGIELQGLDTTGSMWPARQAFLREHGLVMDSDEDGGTNPGVNWKMTAKTILIQIHHKIETFESLGQKFVLVLQNDLMSYMTKAFSFGHLSEVPQKSDSMYFHSYALDEKDGSLSLDLVRTTNRAGIATALNLGANAEMKPEELVRKIQSKMSRHTHWRPV